MQVPGTNKGEFVSPIDQASNLGLKDIVKREAELEKLRGKGEWGKIENIVTYQKENAQQVQAVNALTMMIKTEQNKTETVTRNI